MHLETVRYSTKGNTPPTEDPLYSDDVGKGLVAAGQHFQRVAATPPVTAGAYVSGNVMGGKQTLAGVFRLAGGSVVLTDLFITDKGNQKAPLTLLIFGANPTETYTDHAACPAIVADVPNLVGQILVAAGDYTTTGGLAVAHKAGLNLSLPNIEATTTLYVVAVTTGTPTPASTTDLTFDYRFNRN